MSSYQNKQTSEIYHRLLAGLLTPLLTVVIGACSSPQYPSREVLEIMEEYPYLPKGVALFGAAQEYCSLVTPSGGNILGDSGFAVFATSEERLDCFVRETEGPKRASWTFFRDSTDCTEAGKAIRWGSDDGIWGCWFQDYNAVMIFWTDDATPDWWHDLLD